MSIVDMLPNLLAIVWTGHLVAGLVGAMEGTLTHERWAARSWVIWLVLTAGAPQGGWLVLPVWGAVAVVLMLVSVFRR